MLWVYTASQSSGVLVGGCVGCVACGGYVGGVGCGGIGGRDAFLQLISEVISLSFTYFFKPFNKMILPLLLHVLLTLRMVCHG